MTCRTARVAAAVRARIAAVPDRTVRRPPPNPLRVDRGSDRSGRASARFPAADHGGVPDRHPDRLGTAPCVEPSRRSSVNIVRQPRPAVREHVLATHRASAVEHAHLVVLPTPVHARRTSSIQTSCLLVVASPMLQACRDAHLSLYWRSRRGLFTGRPSRQKTAGARVLRRCSRHRGRVGRSRQLCPASRHRREAG